MRRATSDLYGCCVRVGGPLLKEAGVPLLAVTRIDLHGAPGTEAPCLSRVLSLSRGPCQGQRCRHCHWSSTSHDGRAADGRSCPSCVTTAAAVRW